MNLDKINSVYFLGIGGIGMSALARYFSFMGKKVAGYDKTKTQLTDELSAEGINIHYDDNINLIPSYISKSENKNDILIIYTPAVSQNNEEFIFLKKNSFTIMKRAEVLGFISRKKTGIAVAGTHGKTTVSTMIAHLLYQSEKSCSAFLGGISKNYNSNLLLSETSPFIITEADEFDRSFLYLEPQIAVVTSVDADHLDIYGSYQEIKKSFSEFIGKIQTNGSLILKQGIDIELPKNKFYHIYRYSLNSEADFFAKNIRLENSKYIFDFVTPLGYSINNIICGIPGLVNVENAVAALSAAYLAGVPENELKQSLQYFEGNKRRFDIQFQNEKITYIDDYAHHPEELKAFISSVRELYPGKKITGIFQPHLFSRTKDFADQFALSLSLLDELILTDIYPAREKPIENVSSELILNQVTIENKILCSKEEVIKNINFKSVDIIMTMGAGDIDSLAEQIKEKCNNA